MTFFTIKSILVPLDFSKTSLMALEHGVLLAELTGAQLTLMHAVESIPLVGEPGYFDAGPSFKVLVDLDKAFKTQSNKHLNDIAERIKKKKNIAINTLTVLGRTHKSILDTEKEVNADIIVIGTHGVSGIREFFTGSNTFSVIKDAVCPVLSIRHTRPPGFKNILVPFRNRQHSKEKVDHAIAVAKIYNATIHVLGVDTGFSESKVNQLILETEQIKKLVADSGVACTTKVISDAYIADTTLSYARTINADLIISMSDLDKANIKEYFTGPYAQQIVNHSPIAVLSIRPSAK